MLPLWNKHPSSYSEINGYETSQGKSRMKTESCVFNLHLLNGSLDYATAVTDGGSRLKPSASQHWN